MSANSNGAHAWVLPEALAHQLGQDAFDKAKDQASEVVEWEKRRREKCNLSEIASLKARYDSLFRRRSELLEILRLAPSGDPTHLLHKRWYYRAFALTLILAGILFAHLALAPFGLGWEAWVVCVGIGWVAAFWTERTLEKINCEMFLRCICVLALLTSLGGLLVMALLRGDILALHLNSAVETTNDSVDAGTTFYIHAIWKLQLLMALLAVAMELGSGMAMFEAGKLDLTSFERAMLARKEMAEIEVEMGAVIGYVTRLENEPIISEAEFWRNFHLGLLERIKRNGLSNFIIFLAILHSVGSTASAAPQSSINTSSIAVSDMTMVIALDLTQSVASKGYDGTTDYEKNVDAACQLIAQLSPGAQFTVLAITDRSFAQPYILLQRKLPTDKGPLQFQDRIALAKAHATSEVRRLALSSPHSIPHTDIFGALILAADVLRQSSRRKVLVLFSDMRESSDLDLEHAKTIPHAQALATIEKRGLVAQLRDVDVYALGVDGTGRSVPYWNNLHEFWESYFRKGGANLKRYSALRDVSVLSGDAK